jgi:hypothetical protein
MVNLIKLRGVPEQIDTISETFCHHNDLAEVELCDGVEKIIDGAFACCSFLEGINNPLLLRKTDESRTSRRVREFDNPHFMAHH